MKKCEFVYHLFISCCFESSYSLSFSDVDPHHKFAGMNTIKKRTGQCFGKHKYKVKISRGKLCHAHEEIILHSEHHLNSLIRVNICQSFVRYSNVTLRDR